MGTRNRARAASHDVGGAMPGVPSQSGPTTLEALHREFLDLCAVANERGLEYVIRTHWISAFDEPFRNRDFARCESVLRALRARLQAMTLIPAERRRRDEEAWRNAQERARSAAETERWIERGPRDVLDEIERTNERRVFLTKRGAIAVRGAGTAEYLKVALCHHQEAVRAILRERETTEEIVPAPRVRKGDA